MACRPTNRNFKTIQNRVCLFKLGHNIVPKSAQIVRSGDPATGFAEIFDHSCPAIICFFVWPHLTILFFLTPWRSCYNMYFRPKSRLTVIAAPPPLQKRTPFASSNNRHCPLLLDLKFVSSNSKHCPLLLERPKNDTFQGRS